MAFLSKLINSVENAKPQFPHRENAFYKIVQKEAQKAVDWRRHINKLKAKARLAATEKEILSKYPDWPRGTWRQCWYEPCNAPAGEYYPGRLVPQNYLCAHHRFDSVALEKIVESGNWRILEERWGFADLSESEEGNGQGRTYSPNVTDDEEDRAQDRERRDALGMS